MTLPTRTCEPTRIAEGERLQWQRTFTDFGASLYNLEYRFRQIGGTGHVDIAATASGDTFVAEITEVESAALTAGRYRWQAWLTEKANPSTNSWIETGGFLTVEAGFAHGGSETVAKSMAQQIVESIDAALLKFATTDIQEYEISDPAGMKRVRRGDKAQLLEQRKYWASIVSQEAARDRVASGGTFAQQVKVRLFER